MRAASLLVVGFSALLMAGGDAGASHGVCTPTPSVTALCHFTAPAKSLLADPAWAPATTATPPGGATWSTSVKVMEKARRVALITPGFATWGSIAITTGALYTAAWKMEIPGQGFIYRLVSGEEYGGSTAAINPEWAWMTSGFLSGTPSSPARFVLVKDAGFVQQAYCGSGGNGFVNANFTTLARAVGGTAELSSLGDASWGCGATNTYQKVRTKEQMNDYVETEPMTPGEYSAFGGIKRDTGTFTPGEPDAGQWEDAEEQFGLDTGTFTLAQETMLAMLNGEIDPDWEPDEFTGTIELPEPGVNEAYPEYLIRLQQGGWLGTATVTVLDPADAVSTLGPRAVVRIRQEPEEEGGPVTVHNRPWVYPPPRIPRDTDIRLIVNPPGVPIVVVPPDGLNEDCNCPPIDLSPLETGATTKFPFGAFVWLGEILGDAGDRSDGISFAIGVPLSETDEEWVIEVPENEYRSYTDPVIKLLVVAGSVLFAFFWIVNWRRGGD